MSLAQSFANLKVRTKVFSGFGLVLVILAGVGGMSATSISNIGRDFDTYGQRAVISGIARDIESGIVKLRRHAREFALTAKPEAEKSAGEAARELKDATDRGLATIHSPERRKRVEEVSRLLGVYVKDFARVAELRKHEAQTLNEVLDPAGVKLREDFDHMAEAAARAGNASAQIRILMGTEAVMVARLDVNKAIARHDAALVKKAEDSLSHLRKVLADLEGVAASGELKGLYEDAKAQAAKYEEAFKIASKELTEIDHLVNGEMAREADAINVHAEAISKSAAVEQKDISAHLHALIDTAMTISIVLVAVGLIVGAGFAWLIGTGIANPVTRMTASMQRLAGGDKSVTIPGTERKDEIGQMAATVQVFRDNMVKADELAAEQRAEQERKEKRQSAIEGYISRFETTVAQALKTLTTASLELQSTANAMSATAEQTQRQSGAVAASSEEASANVQTVAAAAEELSSSITEISRQVSQSARIASQAVDEAASTDSKVQNLSEAASKIGDVVKLISDIAGQTNLLALNATIEAARAGEAGKGFAVVASEVKSLATQTARATEEISAQISSIQGETQSSVESIKSIGKTISEINQIATTIASAVEEQGAATQEIARNVSQAAAGTSDVSQNIGGVTQAAAQTGAAATQVLASAGALSKQADTLRHEVDGFLANIRAA